MKKTGKDNRLRTRKGNVLSTTGVLEFIVNAFQTITEFALAEQEKKHQFDSFSSHIAQFQQILSTSCI